MSKNTTNRRIKLSSISGFYKNARPGGIGIKSTCDLHTMAIQIERLSVTAMREPAKIIPALDAYAAAMPNEWQGIPRGQLVMIFSLITAAERLGLITPDDYNGMLYIVSQKRSASFFGATHQIFR